MKLIVEQQLNLSVHRAVRINQLIEGECGAERLSSPAAPWNLRHESSLSGVVFKDKRAIGDSKKFSCGGVYRTGVAGLNLTISTVKLAKMLCRVAARMRSTQAETYLLSFAKPSRNGSEIPSK